MKKVATLVLSIIMVLSLVPLGAFAQGTEKTGEAVTDKISATQKNPLYSEAVYGLDVTAHTQDEIRQFMVANPIDLNWFSADTYAKAPSLKEPYAPGVLSEHSFNNAINAVNQMRFIAGINADVEIDAEYSELVAAGSLLNCLNDTLTHFPERPAQLTASKYDQLYELGYEGTSSSNLSCGYSNIACSVVYGYMNDGDSTNIDRVGHRRWVLYPPMKKTGFGRAGDFSGMYAFDNSGSGNQSFVAWPAQITHTDYFYPMYPWSLSIGTPIETAAVKMVRRSDKKAWEFSSTYSGDGYFNIENSYYGQPGCIIWRPDTLETISNGDVFDVSVHVETYYGNVFDVRYTVSFMDCLNGFMKNSSGGGAYYTNGVVDTSVSGLVKYDGRYHYIKKGVWQNSFTGLVKYNDKWQYVNKGVVDEHYTGMAKNSNGWWYLTDGSIDRSYTGMAKNSNGWWYIKNGKLDRTYTGLAKNANGTWYMVDGKLASSYTGMVKHDKQWWYISKGKWNSSYTGMAKNSNGWWYMKNGKLDLTYTGMAKNSNGWWYMKNGKLDLTYTGLAKNANGTWYMVDGKLASGYTGMVKHNSQWWYISKGKWNSSYTGMAKNSNGWWYMKNGKLDRTFTGIASNENGRWYMQKGRLDQSYSGKVTINGVKYTIRKGKVV